MFDKTIENIKNTQTLYFIKIVMISFILDFIFGISTKLIKKKYKKNPSLPDPQKKDYQQFFLYVPLLVWFLL